MSKLINKVNATLVQHWYIFDVGSFFNSQQSSLPAHDGFLGYDQGNQQSVHNITNESVNEGQLSNVLPFIGSLGHVGFHIGKLINKVFATLTQMTYLMMGNFHTQKSGNYLHIISSLTMNKVINKVYTTLGMRVLTKGNFQLYYS